MRILVVLVAVALSLAGCGAIDSLTNAVLTYDFRVVVGNRTSETLSPQYEGNLIGSVPPGRDEDFKVSARTIDNYGGSGGPCAYITVSAYNQNRRCGSSPITQMVCRDNRWGNNNFTFYSSSFGGCLSN